MALRQFDDRRPEIGLPRGEACGRSRRNHRNAEKRQDDRGFITLDKPRFTDGEKVRVIDGVFSDSFGIYEGMTDRERVEILLDLLGRKVRVQIDIDSVAAA